MHHNRYRYFSICLSALLGLMCVFYSCDGTPGQVTDVEPELQVKSVTLYADKTEITLGGSQPVTFTVKADGQDVTRESGIFMGDGDLLDGNVFQPVAVGEFTFYAVYEEVISDKVMVKVLEADEPEVPVDPEDPDDPDNPVDPEDPEDPDDPDDPDEPEEPLLPSEGKSIVFVEGVTSVSGWYDVNKMGNGTLNGDINMCWAAASANMIQWWQDRYVAAGKQLPATAVTGPGTVYVAAAGRKYELALMDMYHSEWNNDKGCHTAESIPWYFEGVNYGQTASAGSQAYPLTEGGYWSDVWSTVYPHLYHEYSYMFGWYNDLYATEYTAYQHWGNGSSLSGVQRHKKFSEFVVQFIDRGIMSMAVTLNSNGGLNHATTVWGYEIDNATGLVSRLWITDSDDLINEPKEQLLNEYKVSYSSGDNFITLSSDSVRYGKCYVISLNPFSGYGSGN